MKLHFCKPCATGSVRVVIKSFAKKPAVDCHRCGVRDWSRRRFVCEHCVGAGYPDPDVYVGDSPPTRRTCVRGHDGPWTEHPDSAWALGGVRNRIIHRAGEVTS